MAPIGAGSCGPWRARRPSSPRGRHRRRRYPYGAEAASRSAVARRSAVPSSTLPPAVLPSPASSPVSLPASSPPSRASASRRPARQPARSWRPRWQRPAWTAAAAGGPQPPSLSLTRQALQSARSAQPRRTGIIAVSRDAASERQSVDGLSRSAPAHLARCEKFWPIENRNHIQEFVNNNMFRDLRA